MTAQPMICTECEHEIERGDTYVADTRQTERVNRFGAVIVKDAELLATYHSTCAPATGRQS